MREWRLGRRGFTAGAAAALIMHPRSASPMGAGGADAVVDRLTAGWRAPPRTFRPHTRWWWPGNAVTREGIDFQLQEMHRQGMGGVEIVSTWAWYSRGNLAYLSAPWADMVRHAIEKAASLDMEVSLTFGPGWSFGGWWVRPADRSKVLTVASQDIVGPTTFSRKLPPLRLRDEPDSFPGNYRHGVPEGPGDGEDWAAHGDEQIVGVVAGRVAEGGPGDAGEALVGGSLVDLTEEAKDGGLRWSVPEGRWRLMVFRLKYTRQQNQAQNEVPRNWVVDHLNKSAMQSYCDQLMARLHEQFGKHFGTTVDSLFCDSFEILSMPDTLLWSIDTLATFQRDVGYDLRHVLPALWWKIGEQTPRIRYDVNQHLHRLVLETTFRTFVDAAAARNVEARIQPHARFLEELIEGAGRTPRPEVEYTTARFETVADGRKATVAGAHFYGRPIVSAEAYTYTHLERYRTTLEDLKIGTDAFLRDGVTQLYNHGYVYTPEKEIAPSRDIPWANRISHVNTWWPYYGHLARYVSRACFLLRQGRFVGDVLIYSPQATVWSDRALFVNKRRVMPYGTVPRTLLANGYDYDPVNDDVLQERARVEGRTIAVGSLRYRFLILPAIVHIPIATLERMREFVTAGGVVIALGVLPSRAVGLRAGAAGDDRVRATTSDLFRPGRRNAYHLPDYKIEQEEFSPFEQPWRPTPPITEPQRRLIDILGKHLAPDFSLPEGKTSDGLTFIHRQDGPVDLYFVTNLQPHAADTTVTFRLTGRHPEAWNPMTGRVAQEIPYRPVARGIEIPLRLEPWESRFYVFRPGNRRPPARRVRVPDLPAALPLTGDWKITLEGPRFARREGTMSQLVSWTDDPRSRSFSGTGRYELAFDLPAAYARKDLALELDLGRVCDVAEVYWNDRHAGVAWMQPHRLDVTGMARAGRNTVRVLVTNTPHNAVSAMKEPLPFPKELEAHYGPEAPGLYKAADVAWQRDRAFAPVPSGLLGPVSLLPRPGGAL